MCWTKTLLCGFELNVEKLLSRAIDCCLWNRIFAGTLCPGSKTLKHFQGITAARHIKLEIFDQKLGENLIRSLVSEQGMNSPTLVMHARYYESSRPTKLRANIWRGNYNRFDPLQFVWQWLPVGVVLSSYRLCSAMSSEVATRQGGNSNAETVQLKMHFKWFLVRWKRKLIQNLKNFEKRHIFFSWDWDKTNFRLLCASRAQFSFRSLRRVRTVFPQTNPRKILWRPLSCSVCLSTVRCLIDQLSSKCTCTVSINILAPLEICP